MTSRLYAIFESFSRIAFEKYTYYLARFEFKSLDLESSIFHIA